MINDIQGSKICITRIIEEKNMAKKRKAINKQSIKINKNLRKFILVRNPYPLCKESTQESWSTPRPTVEKFLTQRDYSIKLPKVFCGFLVCFGI